MVYTALLGVVRNKYLYHHTTGGMSTEQLRFEMDADEFEAYLSRLEGRREMERD